MVVVDWKEKRIKHILDLINGGTPKSNVEEYWSENEIVWITPEDLSKPGKKIENSIRKISRLGLENSSATFIKEGSIVISTRAPIGNMKISTVPFTTNQGCKSLQLKDNTNDIRFFYYWLYVNKDYLNQLGRGTTFRELSNYDLKNIKLNVPASKEQTNIANFLDIKSSEIDSLISDKKRLIELLEEKRQAIITETVTKGLDPNVKMKDSGIEWIGEIPEHWETVKLKFLGDATMGLLYSPTETTYKEQGKLVLRASNIQSSMIDIQREDNVYVNKEIPESLITKVDDILICARSGSRDLIGKSALIDEHSAGNSFGAFTTVFRSEYNDFISYVFRSGLFQSQIGTYLTSTINQLTMSNLRNLEIVLPSKEEQKTLVGFLGKYDKDVNDSIEIIKKQIFKLKEYRESLIYEAVTGKIDLRSYNN